MMETRTIVLGVAGSLIGTVLYILMAMFLFGLM